MPSRAAFIALEFGMVGISPEHVAVVGTLVLLEGLLSADNALVLAIQVRHLPKSQRQKALLFGMVGALALRGLGILFARQIVGRWWVCGLGALYLFGLSAHHFMPHRGRGVGVRPVRGDKPQAPRRSFLMTVLVVEITDFFFAIDSLLVAVAISHNPWALYIGAFLGILMLRLAAGLFIRLIEKYPSLDNLAYALVAWAGVKLAARTVELLLIANGAYTTRTIPNLMPAYVFWPVMALIVIVGGFVAWRNSRLRELPDAEEATADHFEISQLEV